MKLAYTYIVLFVLMVACSPPHSEKPILANSDEKAIVVDFPAAVIINKSEFLSNKPQAISLFDEMNIPVIDSITSGYVFIKNNGDKVSIETREVENKYDIILFNKQNDPVPCRLADLNQAVAKIFQSNSQNLASNRYKQHQTLENVSDNFTDTISGKKLRLFRPFGKMKPKQLILSIADTAKYSIVPRSVLPVEWIIQRLDSWRSLVLTFENDLITFANTDRYFTNGIAIELHSPQLANLPLSNIMLNYRQAVNVSYSAGIYQDMYTPTDTRVAPTLKQDRPYASYLYLGYRKISANPHSKVSLTSEFNFGYIGPYSPGSYMQTVVHKAFPTNDVPIGWETQIKTDVIANYNIGLEKAIVTKPNFLISATFNTKVGTLLNSASVGANLVVGKFEPFFGFEHINQRPKLNYALFLKTDFNAVVYNALLQGGILNHDNIFTLRSNEVSRLVGRAQVGLHFTYKSTGIELAQHFLSPEYKGGLWHKWGRISLLFKLK